MTNAGSMHLWHDSRASLVFGNDRIHVWSIDRNAAIDHDDELRTLLPPGEFERGAHLRSALSRRHVLMDRAGLRGILSRYVGRDPRQISFKYGPLGKPVLDEPGCNIEFSFARSAGLALCAITRHARIGIDIERVQNDIDPIALAEQFFSVREAATLWETASDKRVYAFYSAWTRKEAFLKAKGTGLSMSPDSFSVSLIPGHPPGLLEVRDDPEEIHRWTLHDIPVNHEYVAALAVELIKSPVPLEPISTPVEPAVHL